MPEGRTSVISDFHRRVAGLLSQVGISPGADTLQMRTGGNNRVYRVRGESRDYVIKEYFRHPGDSRDRLGAEFAFARFAWSNGIYCIPEPIACDVELGLGLFGFVEGESLKPGSICRDDVKQAMVFVKELNRFRELPSGRQLSAGSEACFSIRRHLDMVRLRLERLEGIPQATAIDLEAKRFVQARLVPAHAAVEGRILECLAERQLAVDIELPAGERIISPSDFGFHNALRRSNGSLVFLDFEYAGWDDPAKLTGDFFSQVAVPVPLDYRDEVLAAVAEACADVQEDALWRMKLLLPLYRIKWCCIILNHFLQIDAARRDFAKGEAVEGKLEQLDKARLLLNSLDGLHSI